MDIFIKMANKARSRYIIGTVTCLLLGLAVFLIEQNVESKFSSEISKSLISLARTTESAVNIITIENRQTLVTVAGMPTIIKATEELIRESTEDKSSLAVKSKKEVKSLITQIATNHNYHQYFIITPNNKILISSRNNSLNLLRQNNRQAFFDSIWKGNTLLSSPLIYQEKKNLNTSILVGTPIRNAQQEIIAAMVFSFKVEEHYGAIFENAQIGDTGESYAINSTGQILNNTRFKSLLATADNQQQLSVDINRMIDFANFNFIKQSVTSNFKGYNNYRGKNVIGVWVWNPLRHYFIISEIEVAEAYGPMIDIRIISIISFIIFYLFMLQLIFLFNKNEKVMLNSKHKLEASKLRLRLAFENIPSGNIVSDWHGIIIEFSKSAEVIFGYTSKEMVGKNVNLLMPETDHSHHDKYIKNFLSTGVHKMIGTGGRNTSGLHKNGNTVPIHICIGTMVVDYEMFFIASITDQTLQTKINKQLFDSQKMKAVGQLSSGLTHDFNNLLGIAIGNLQLLERKTTLDELSSKKVTSALQALNRGASLTSQLLNFTRPDNKSAGPICINESILGIKDLIEQTATRKINIVYSLAEKLQYVDLKFGELGDVLINLTANARDAMPDGGTLFIETSSYCDENNLQNEFIHLTVRDTGIGIDDKKLGHIFEPFYTTKERSKGTGLGLAMVSNFIKMANGEIKVYSDVGVGTSFNLYFPVTTQQISKATPLKKKSSLGGDETILLIDDEIELLSIAQDNLIEAGYTVIICSSAEEAIEILKTNNKIELLLSDIIMPTKLDGFELAVLATNLKPNLKIALMSGFSAKVGEKQVDGNLLAKYFARHLLQKPYSRKELLKYVRNQLDIKQLVPWNAHSLTGIEALDDDHRALNYIINAIYTKILTEQNPNLGALLIELDKFVLKHHHREELVLDICQSSNSKEHKKVHKKEHEIIQKRLASYATGHLKIITSDDHQQLLDFLKTLISSHVEQESIQLKYLTTEYSDAIHEALLNQ